MRLKIVILIVFFIFLIGIVTADIEIKGSENDRVINLQTLVQETFLALTDTPSSYAGSGGLCLKVNAGATAVSFEACNATGGGGSGGNISSIIAVSPFILGGGNTGDINISLNESELEVKTLNQTEADLIYLNLSGTNANQDINISPFNMRLKNITLEANIKDDSDSIRTFFENGVLILEG